MIKRVRERNGAGCAFSDPIRPLLVLWMDGWNRGVTRLWCICLNPEKYLVVLCVHQAYVVQVTVAGETCLERSRLRRRMMSMQQSAELCQTSSHRVIFFQYNVVYLYTAFLKNASCDDTVHITDFHFTFHTVILHPLVDGGGGGWSCCTND